MKTVLLVVLLFPIGIFLGLIFSDIVLTMRRSINKLKTNVRSIRRGYLQNEQSYYKKGQNYGKVVKTKLRAIK